MLVAHQLGLHLWETKRSLTNSQKLTLFHNGTSCIIRRTKLIRYLKGNPLTMQAKMSLDVFPVASILKII
uniref:Uncharacterized protein n=1 Tax=Arundo donax TaxID=35708 RepID=A0A0A9ERJ9_ARUDO